MQFNCNKLKRHILSVLVIQGERNVRGRAIHRCGPAILNAPRTCFHVARLRRRAEFLFFNVHEETCSTCSKVTPTDATRTNLVYVFCGREGSQHMLATLNEPWAVGIDTAASTLPKVCMHKHARIQKNKPFSNLACVCFKWGFVLVNWCKLYPSCCSDLRKKIAGRVIALLKHAVRWKSNSSTSSIWI